MWRGEERLDTVFEILRGINPKFIRQGNDSLPLSSIGDVKEDSAGSMMGGDDLF